MRTISASQQTIFLSDSETAKNTAVCKMFTAVPYVRAKEGVVRSTDLWETITL